jgi:hypothetical protein
MQPIIQQPTDLKLIVTDNPMTEQLTIIKSAILEASDWQFTFNIIGESHSVSIQHDNIAQLQETLVCGDLPPERCLHYHSFAAQADHRYQANHYTIEVRFTNQPTRGQFMLEYVFPNVGDQTPMTGIGWRQESHGMMWWTLHTYPYAGGCTYVETRSYYAYMNRG